MSVLVRAWRGARALLSKGVLLLVYAVVITPVGLASQALRADPLARRRSPEAETYWEARSPPAREHLFGFLADRGKLWLVPVIAVLVLVGLAVVVSEGSLFLAFLYPLF